MQNATLLVTVIAENKNRGVATLYSYGRRVGTWAATITATTTGALLLITLSATRICPAPGPNALDRPTGIRGVLGLCLRAPDACRLYVAAAVIIIIVIYIVVGRRVCFFRRVRGARRVPETDVFDGRARAKQCAAKPGRSPHEPWPGGRRYSNFYPSRVMPLRLND